MIVVDICVPIIEKMYDFSLNENTSVETVIDEVIEIIAQKEGCFENRESVHMALYSYDNQKQLSPSLSLMESGVDDGSRLLLV